MPVSTLIAGALVYALGLSTGYHPSLWWLCYTFWMLYLFLKSTHDSFHAFTVWLVLFLVLPKRNPNQDFVTALNVSQGLSPTSFPLFELLLFGAALTSIICLRRSNIEPTKTSLRRAILSLGLGLLAYSGLGLGLAIYNINWNSEYFNPQLKAYGIARLLRMMSEGLIVTFVARVKWDFMARLVRFKTTLYVAAVVGAIELGLWLLPFDSLPMKKFIQDFRGGFRPLGFGIATGTMLAEAWLFLLCVFAFFHNKIGMVVSAALGLFATLVCYHRTQFGAFVLSLSIILFWPKAFGGTFLRVVIAAALLVISPLLFQNAASYFRDVSSRKGSDYMSVVSIQSRLDLARVSIQAQSLSPVLGLGIGFSALPAYTVKMLMEGSVGSTEFTDTFVAVDERAIVDRGDRIYDSHNIFVSMVTEAGLVGLFCVIQVLVIGCLMINSAVLRERVFPLAMWAGLVLVGMTQAEPYIFSLTVIVAALFASGLPPGSQNVDLGGGWKRRLSKRSLMRDVRS